MLFQKLMWICLLIIVIIKEIALYVQNHSSWSDCKYPLDLWFCITILGLSVVLIICLCLYNSHSRRSLRRYEVLVFLPLLQLINLVCAGIGTAWSTLVLLDEAECVIFT